MAKLDDIDAGFRDLKLVCAGGVANVLAEEETFMVLQCLAENDEERWSHLHEVMKRYCADQNLTKRQWNSEGRHGNGNHREVGLFAMKGWQFRLYGFQRSINGKKCFVAVDVDTSKKTDRADQKLLKRAAKACAPFMD